MSDTEENGEGRDKEKHGSDEESKETLVCHEDEHDEQQPSTSQPCESTSQITPMRQMESEEFYPTSRSDIFKSESSLPLVQEGESSTSTPPSKPENETSKPPDSRIATPVKQPQVLSTVIESSIAASHVGDDAESRTSEVADVIDEQVLRPVDSPQISPAVSPVTSLAEVTVSVQDDGTQQDENSFPTSSEPVDDQGESSGLQTSRQPDDDLMQPPEDKLSTGSPNTSQESIKAKSLLDHIKASPTFIQQCLPDSDSSESSDVSAADQPDTDSGHLIQPMVFSKDALTTKSQENIETKTLLDQIKASPTFIHQCLPVSDRSESSGLSASEQPDNDPKQSEVVQNQPETLSKDNLLEEPEVLQENVEATTPKDEIQSSPTAVDQGESSGMPADECDHDVKHSPAVSKQSSTESKELPMSSQESIKAKTSEVKPSVSPTSVHSESSALQLSQHQPDPKLTRSKHNVSTGSPVSSGENVDAKTVKAENPPVFQFSGDKKAEATCDPEGGSNAKAVSGSPETKHSAVLGQFPTVEALVLKAPKKSKSNLVYIDWESMDTDDDHQLFQSCNIQSPNRDVSYSSHITDKSMADCPVLPGGTVRFIQDCIENQTDHYYVCIPRDGSANSVANYMECAWRRRTPSIVLSILSSANYYTPWENERSVDNFKRGIIQAANLTEMWILTDGIDTGVAKKIGDAAYHEMARRTSQQTDSQVVKNIKMVEKVTKLTVLGVVNKKEVSYADQLTGNHNEPIYVENIQSKPASAHFDLNPNHTHFILAEDVEPQELINFWYNLEIRFQLPVGKTRLYCGIPSSQITLLTGSETDIAAPTAEGACTPVIGLLIQGGPLDIDHTLALLKKKIPVIVMKGFGKAADLVAFAYEEMMESYDKDHMNIFVKPELMKKVTNAFPKYFKNNDLARNLFRDEILECALMAHQDGLTYLTVIDTTSKESDLTKLNKYILTALFKAKTRKLGIRWREQIQRDLQLTLDWNCPDLADSEIFTKYSWIRIKVEDYLFHQALIRPKRWKFVKLFLKKGFQVHRYLHQNRLHNLFENAIDKEFFIGVCLEGVLGKSVDPYAPLDKEFVETERCELNRLLYQSSCLSKLVKPYTLSMNALGIYITDKIVAERIAVNTLVLWAAVTNRTMLTKIFLKNSQDPMAVALIVSMIMHNLATTWCKESDLQSNVLKTAVEFGQMAVSLLDLCYKDSSNQAFKALDKKLPDFNDKTVVEIARISKNKWFIAHPCCQKWLSQRWYGNLKIRGSMFGLIKLPDWLKLYLSAFLIFPMYLWIYFEPKGIGKQKFETDDDEEIVQELATPLPVNTKMKKSFLVTKLHQYFALNQLGWQLPIWKRVFYLWSAPITKFYISQLFYIAYLCLFSVAVLVPNCGYFYLNVAVLLWTALIWIELVEVTLFKKKNYPEFEVVQKSFEILVIFIFLMIFLLFWILPHFVEYMDYMTTKSIVSICLLLFYYRTLAVFLPMSRRLGPMLICMEKMVRKDFSTWMRIFLIVMVAGAVTIQAVMYPNYPLTLIGLRKAFARAMFTMFLTKIDDLDGDDSCTHLYDNKSEGYCKDHTTSIQAHPLLVKCPYSSGFGYVIVIQYLIIVKLFLITLLYAMFSVTSGKITMETEEIWKYQRYTIVIDFEDRRVLPPPLNLVGYIFLLLHKIWKAIQRHCRKKKKPSVEKTSMANQSQLVDINYWKSCVKLYTKHEEHREAEKNRGQEQSESLSLLTKDVEQQRENQKKMSERIVHVEKNVTACRLLLEEMKHMLQNQDLMNKGITPARQLLHTFSRQSPYPGTRIQRFSVFDKYVSWEVEYEMYDPTYLTKPAEEFIPERVPFVDPDILELKRQDDDRQKMTTEELDQLPPLKEFNPKWNSVVEEEVDIGVIEVDRTSWITINDEKLQYRLDKSGIPQNPLGRTGIRGRGDLWRWGPNHRISAVITRWKRNYTAMGFPSDYCTIEGKKVLEFIGVPRSDTGELTLPGGNVYGRASRYRVMCEEFSKCVLLEDFRGSLSFGEEEMKQFFCKFAVASTPYRIFAMNIAVKGFSAKIVYRGYNDNPSNTDNAWREAEVWNFHYELNDAFDKKIPVREKVWKEINSDTRLYGNQDFIIKEVAKIQNSYF